MRSLVDRWLKLVKVLGCLAVEVLDARFRVCLGTSVANVQDECGHDGGGWRAELSRLLSGTVERTLREDVGQCSEQHSVPSGKIGIEARAGALASSLKEGDQGRGVAHREWHVVLAARNDTCFIA